MASTYYLVKLFQRAKFERLKGNLDYIRESPAMTFSEETSNNKCRICLKEGTIPIYRSQGTDIAEDICTFGNIEVCEDDKSLHFICDPCHKLLEAAVLFRKTALKSDMILKNTVAKKTTCLIKPEDLGNVENRQEEAKSSTLVLENLFSTSVSGTDITADANKSKPVISTKKIAPDKVQCGVCFKIISKPYYKEHYALHDHTLPRHVCDICGKSFRQRCSYRKHYVTHSSEFPYKCKLCPYRGRHSALLKNHMHTHSGDFRFMCTECPARFVIKSNLNKHALRHKEPMFRCDTCQRGFHSKLNLERHFEADHLGIKNHACNLCGKVFAYRKAMMRHLLGVHKREKKMKGRTPAYVEAELKKLNTYL